MSNSWLFLNLLSSRCNLSSCSFWSKTCICLTRHVRHTFLIFNQFHIFLSSARTVLSSQDFGVEQMNFEQMTLLGPVVLRFYPIVPILTNILGFVENFFFFLEFSCFNIWSCYDVASICLEIFSKINSIFFRIELFWYLIPLYLLFQ